LGENNITIGDYCNLPEQGGVLPHEILSVARK
jgi:hypothetical protein